jgi:cysteine-rich repeat protein
MVTTTGEECDDGNATSGDGCEAGCHLTVCAGGMGIEKPVVRILNLGPPFGDEHVLFSGIVRMDRDDLDPHQDGLQVLLEEARPGGARLLALTHATHPIPPGGPGSGCGRWDGWRNNWFEREFVYAVAASDRSTSTCSR